MNYVAGLDIGTTGAKIVLFKTNGELVDKFYRPYPSSRGSSGHEMDPLAIKESVLALVKDVLQECPDLLGIGVTSFGESFVCLDENDEPLFPILLYTDPRGEEEAKFLTSKLGEKAIERKTGLKPHAMYSLPKLAYLKNHDSETFSKVKKVFLMEDYAIYLLSGKRGIDPSLASRTLGYNVEKNCYDQEIFDALGIDPSLFPPILPSGSPIRGLKKELAESKEDFILSPCGHDQFACALGSGVVNQGEAMEGAGTVESLIPCFNGEASSNLSEDCFNLVPYFDIGHLTYAFSYTGGACADWFLKAFCSEEERKDPKIHERLSSHYNGRPTGMLWLPHFAGAATPYMDLGSKACCLGMDLSTRREDFYLAVLEGVAYELKVNLDALNKHGVPVERLIASGGGSKNPVWNQIKADVTGLPLYLLDGEEAGCRGSAMLVSVASGCYPSLKEAMDAFVHVKKIVKPNPEAREAYAKMYRRYARVYKAVRPLMEDEQ